MMPAALPKTSAVQVLCWCGADDGLRDVLERNGRRGVNVVCTPSEFLEAFHEGAPACVVLGGKPASDTISLLHTIRHESGDTPVLVALSAPSADEVRLFLRKGAQDVLWFEELDSALADIMGTRAGRPAPKPLYEPGQLVCLNDRMKKVADIARRIAPTDATVLIQGESGTGKELIASMIHALSRRQGHAFVTVNCGAIPEPLLESQLYGHEKGSFTGAVKQQKGLFEAAEHGTIFLDEIGEMGLEMQVKLLRFLQNREFRRVGGHEVIKVNVRVLAASNRDLRDEVARGRFRTDLFYRLNVITLVVPPLRERPEEIPVLIEHFLRKVASQQNLSDRTFAPDAVEHMRRLPWPGNVRELENAVERLLLLSTGDEVTREDLEEFLELPVGVAANPPDLSAIDAAEPAGALEESETAWPTLAEVERAHIARVLSAFGWNKMRTARTLGINVKTLYNKIKAYRLMPPSDRASDV